MMRLHPPIRDEKPLSREEVRAALAEREATERFHEEVRAAGAILAKIQAEALNPEKGWWRPPQKRHYTIERVLRHDAVLPAIAVGCSHAEIRRAAGATKAELIGCLHRARGGATPKDEDAIIRRWRDILQDAEARGLTARQVQDEQGASESLVRQSMKFHGYRRLANGVIARRSNVESAA